MKRGDVDVANLNPSRGSEQAGIRPVILVQHNHLERFTSTVVVVPLTTNLRRAEIPGTLLIPGGDRQYNGRQKWKSLRLERGNG